MTPRPMSHAQALELVRDVIPELPVAEMPKVIGALAELQALANIRVHSREPEGDIFVTATQAARIIGISPRTLYDMAPGLTWARKTGPRKWEFLLAACQDEKRRRAK